METTNQRYWRTDQVLWTALGVFALLLGPLSIHAEPLQIHQTQTDAITVHRRTQQSEDRWAEQKPALEARFHDLAVREKTLQKEKAVLEEQIRMVQARQVETRRRIAESAGIRKNLQFYLDAVVGRLEQVITGSLPFLAEERAARIDALRKAMIQPDAGAAEKCRQVMEALKIETEYGHTVEVYQQAIQIDGFSDNAPVVADILRVGRLALFWRTPDTQTVGHWDRAAEKWTRLPDTYRRHINEAAEMALKRRTVDMVKLPLGRIVVQ